MDTDRPPFLLVSKRASGHVLFAAPNRPDRLVDYKVTPQADPFYEEFYADTAKSLAGLRRTQVEDITKIIMSNLGGAGNRKRTLLDVGCGSGHAVTQIAEQHGQHLDPWGIDPFTNSQHERIRKVGFFELKSSNLESTFDIIMFLDVLEHFEEPSKVLSACKRHLIDDGLLLVKVPNKDSLLYRVTKWVRLIAPALSRKVLNRLFQLDYPPPHYFYFNAQSLEPLLTENGFEIVETRFQSEIPWSHMWERLWGIPRWKRLLMLAILVPMKLVTIGSLNDCLVMVAKPVAK